ncbi:hypothetical protein [Pseudothermotoga sp.]|uniref:hypothetical protein n=1 Tax=Pseudothermotoga sp. TaxID=2033661 RepID=UPI000E803330|nr:hypothetical protein [Pseudothermotoga sp.]HBJ80730.1 hypothetical protein [Pseudothermotoga sp.]
MVNKERRWSVSEVESAEELAEKLTGYVWTLCTGFRYKGYLFLNDSFSENSAQEYGVIKESTWTQIESITFSWCTKEKALGYIKDIVSGKYDSGLEWESGITPEQIETSEQLTTLG